MGERGGGEGEGGEEGRLKPEVQCSSLTSYLNLFTSKQIRSNLFQKLQNAKLLIYLKHKQGIRMSSRWKMLSVSVSVLEKAPGRKAASAGSLIASTCHLHLGTCLPTVTQISGVKLYHKSKMLQQEWK